MSRYYSEWKVAAGYASYKQDMISRNVDVSTHTAHIYHARSASA